MRDSAASPLPSALSRTRRAGPAPSPDTHYAADLAFVLRFLAVFVVLQLGYYAIPEEALHSLVIHHGTVRVSAGIIHLIAPAEAVSAIGNRLASPRAALEVIRGRDRSGSLFLLIAAVATFRADWRHKLPGLAAAAGLMFARSELYLEVRTRDVVPGLAGQRPGVPRVHPAVLGVGVIAQSLVITLGVVLAWPATGPGQRLWLLFLGACAALLAQVLTVPFFLLGEVESLARAFTAGAHAGRPLVRLWFLVLDNGGVWAVSLAAGVAAVVMARGSTAPAAGAAPTLRGPRAAGRMLHCKT